MMMETIPPGTILHARYRIERALGSGGFGHVYLAIDQRTGQQCAVKEYLVSGSSGQAQLQHEARVLSRLHHPNMPVFVDAFSERGRYYIALSYIEGNDLTDYMRMARQHNETIPIRRVIGWILSTCDAVQFLHSQQPAVIHRDIKPDNIRITPDGTAILVDLGNAKAVADGARTLFFARHQGTPGYAPPEQYPGGIGTDARSDVYALGGTLYFALTSQEPASVSTRNQSLQQGLADLPSLQEQLASNPPEMSPENNQARQFRLGVSKPAKPVQRHSRHLAQLGMLPPEVLHHLNEVIQRAMALRPNERYQTIAEFSNEIKKVLNTLPAEPAANPPTQTPRRSDPNSTQPDLPMLYETLQAAREREQAKQPASPQSPGGPSSPAAFHCPHCNATLIRRATFCPQCGTPLPSAPDAPSASTFEAHRNISPFQNRAVEELPQKPSMQATLSPASQTSGQDRPSSFYATGREATPSRAGTSRAPGPFLPGQQSPSAGGQVQHTPTPGNIRAQTRRAKQISMQMKVIIVSIILVILLALLFFLLIISRGHGTASLFPGNAYMIEAYLPPTAL